MSGLGLQITPVAIGEVPFRRIVRILRVHAPTQNRLELVASLRVQVHRVQTGAEGKPGAQESAVEFGFVAAEEQSQVGYTDRLERRGAKECAVEQVCDVPGMKSGSLRQCAIR